MLLPELYSHEINDSINTATMYRQYLKQCRNKQVNMKYPLTDSDLTGSNTDTMIVIHGGNEEDTELGDTLQLNTLSNHVHTLLSPEKKERKLILHFDIRNTVLVADSVTNVCVEQALNSFLTGVTWGHEDSDGRWQWHSDQLSLTPPAPNVITYYKHLEKKFVKNTTDRTQLRLATGDFSQSDIGRHFHPHFQNHLELLKWRHEFNRDSHDILTMSGKDGQQYNYIVPAVYKCIHYLIQNQRDFAIVFRTFGLDAPNVIRSLTHGLKGNHPGFPEPVHLPVDTNIGTVKRGADTPTVCSLTGPNNNSFTGDRDIYDMLCQRVGISGFRDDVHYWLENNYHHNTSKPHIIDPFDPNVHHIFFDDNFRPFEEDSIIDVRLFETRGAREARSLSNMELAQFENVCLVQADLLRCIEDEDYYVDRINQCESNYSKFLKKFSALSRSVSVQDIL